MILNIRKALLAVYCFFFIFNPMNFSNFNLFYLYFIIALFFFFSDFAFFKKIILKQEVFIVLVSLMFLILYLLSWYFFGGSQDALYRAYVYFLLISSLVCSVFICGTFYKIYNGTFEDFINFLTIIGSFQLIFVFISVFVPDFREWIFVTSRNERLEGISNQFGILRSFGLANGYTSFFPMLLGIFSLILVSKSIFGNATVCRSLFYLFLSLLFLIAAVINARIGAIPFLLFLIFYGISSFFHVKRFFLLMIFSLVSVFLVSTLPEALSDGLFARVWMGLDEIGLLLDGRISGTFLTLSKMFYFPSVFNELILGTGYTPFGNNNFGRSGSDIGFVRDIFVLGFINFLLLGFSFIPLFCNLFFSVKKYYGFVFLMALIFSIFLFYVKGAILSYSELYSVLILLAVYSLMGSKVNLKNIAI